MALDLLLTSIEEQIAAAKMLFVTRLANGGMSVTVDEGQTFTTEASDAFLSAITGLVALDVNLQDVGSVAMRRVSPPLEFGTTGRVDFFNISVAGLDGKKIAGSHEGIKSPSVVAQKLAARLSPV